MATQSSLLSSSFVLFPPVVASKTPQADEYLRQEREAWDLSLPAAGIVYVDTAPIIYTVEHHADCRIIALAVVGIVGRGIPRSAELIIEALSPP